ncbi:serine protease [Pseudarthrobacter sp. PvP004]|uniref:S8 family serine peptidase n=1 Tax=Pseudarthrobacter sp. PvP004 TaxID=2817850 RepID=UPI0025706744|nr:S8 family serine peptidase [Pseudarthrobacter sp. PvP004]MBP2264753.1 serine protease [Pseudarthrobacter sp. PvP004]
MLERFRAPSFRTVGVAVTTLLFSGGLAALPAVADESDIVSSTTQAMQPALEIATDQFIVGLREDNAGAQAAETAGNAVSQAATKLGVLATNLRESATGGHIVKLDEALPADEAEVFLDALRSDPAVEYAEPDAIMQTAADPNDGLYSLQWDLWEDFAGLRAPGAWEYNRGQGVVVAVVDTGITSHFELDGNVLPGYDMISSSQAARDGDGRDADPTDEGDWISANQCYWGSPQGVSSWHGTHVAGTVAAIGGNGKGVTGVAPEAKILPLRALGACGGYTSDIADSIVWAAGGVVSGAPINPNPARVINLSLGGISPCSASYQNAINFAYNSGAAVVVAAGNSNRPAADSSPANCQNVITVAASGRNGARAPYSNYGSAVDVTAPGGDISFDVRNGILSTSNFGATTREDPAYEFMQGTSMAAPHVAGVAALWFSELGGMTNPESLERRLKATSRPLPGGCPAGCGSGLVDAAAALDIYLPSWVIPLPVLFTDEDGTLGDSFTIPEVTGVEYLVGGNAVAAGTYPGTGTVTVAARALKKYVLAEGAASEWAHEFKATPFVVTPAPVTFTDVDGTKDDTYTIPATEGVEYLVGGNVVAAGKYPGSGTVTVTAKALTDYVLAEGAVSEWAHEFKATPFVVTPAPVTFTDVDGTKDDTYTIPATEGVEYLVGGNVVAAGKYPGSGTVTVTAKALTDYVLAEGATSEWSQVFKATPFVVTPAPVTFADADGTKDDTYTIPATEGVEYLVGGNVVAAGTFPGSGTVTITARAMTDYVLAEGTVTEWSQLFKTTPAPVVFADLPVGAQFFDEISWLAAQGISTGWTEADGSKSFRPVQAVNRDAMAAFMYRLAGSPAFNAPAVSPFADITPSTQFYKEITWLASQGISTGWIEANGSKTFRPVQPVNRDAMAAFMYRFAGKPAFVDSQVFVDVPPGAQFHAEISWLSGAGISTGWTAADGSKTFQPLVPVNRDAMAAFMYRYHQKYMNN